jgi:hypothetical protein
MFKSSKYIRPFLFMAFILPAQFAFSQNSSATKSDYQTIQEPLKNGFKLLFNGKDFKL